MSEIVYLNGQYIRQSNAAINVMDRGFLFADAVYEVVACIHGHIADETAHLDRLERSLNELNMILPIERQTLQFLMREVLRRNKRTNAAIYIQISRGVASKRDFKFPENAKPTLFIMAPYFDFDQNAGVLNGFKVKTVHDIRWKRRDIKSVLLLPQSMAKQDAVENNFDDAWMIDEAGYITEASAANAYIVKNNTIITRPVSCDILKGTTRNAIEKLCHESNMVFEERVFKLNEAYEADEAFCTGATTQVTGVVQINQTKIGSGQVGSVTKYLFDEYRAYVEGLRGAQISWEAGLK